jgi:hypothetical protein
MGQGLTAGQALEKSAPVFWQNMGTLTATNAAGYFVGMPPAIKNKFLVKAGQAVKAAFTEGGQERAQAVIQDVAAGRGEWADFLDPSKYQTETIVGAVVGGALGGLGPIEGKPGENRSSTVVRNHPPPRWRTTARRQTGSTCTRSRSRTPRRPPARRRLRRWCSRPRRWRFRRRSRSPDALKTQGKSPYGRSLRRHLQSAPRFARCLTPPTRRCRTRLGA